MSDKPLGQRHGYPYLDDEGFIDLSDAWRDRRDQLVPMRSDAEHQCNERCHHELPSMAYRDERPGLLGIHYHNIYAHK